MSATVGTVEMGVTATFNEVKRAHDLVNCIKVVHFMCGCPKSTLMAWIVLSKAVGSALSYDVRLLPRKVLVAGIC